MRNLVEANMEIHHIHFYVNDASTFKDWFVSGLGFQATGSIDSCHTHTEIVNSGAVYFLISSPKQEDSPVARFLQRHPPGVADVAFYVADIYPTFHRAIAHGAACITPIQSESRLWGQLHWAQVSGWGDLTHTLIASEPRFLSVENSLPQILDADLIANTKSSERRECQNFLVSVIQHIDHAVLNVAMGDLDAAIHWYEQAFGFQQQQAFTIQTDCSALRSKVLTHPGGNIRFPVNEPGSASSQIQEFLDINQGAGIQHVALATPNIVKTVAQIRRQANVCFLDVPVTYYEQLQNRFGFYDQQADWEAIAQQGILVDWAENNPKAMLLQIFTQPIFEQPTFFFEFIQRQVYQINDQFYQAQGFGEGNFRALFEAIEREQIKRGSLQPNLST
jgi:4-hydroxyphenylpyruvate dioxygenase